MRTAGIKPGDMLDVEIKGQSSYMVATGPADSGVMAKSLHYLGSKHHGERKIGSRQIKGIYRKAAGSR